MSHTLQWDGVSIFKHVEIARLAKAYSQSLRAFQQVRPGAFLEDDSSDKKEIKDRMELTVGQIIRAYIMPNLDIQQPQRGKLSTRSINFMSQNSGYDSDSNLDTVYNVLLTQCNNVDKETMVNVMQAVRKSRRTVWRKKPNLNAMLPPKTWKKASPEFKRLWLQLNKNLKVEMLNQGKKNSELITTLPAQNAAFLADMLFDFNKTSASYDSDDSGYETAHKN